jgi:undecaprenyl-diphosphatase
MLDVRARLISGVAILLIVLFAALALALRDAAGTTFDLILAGLIQRVDHPVVTTLMVWVSGAGDAPWIWLILGGATIGLIMAGRRREACFVAMTYGAVQLATVVKPLVGRPRPTADVIRVMSEVADFSYPSGHVVAYVTLCGLLCYLGWTLLEDSWRRTTLLTVLGLLIVLVGISRVHLGHHWPSDVIGGYALGTAYLLLLVEAYRLLAARETSQTAVSSPEAVSQEEHAVADSV